MTDHHMISSPVETTTQAHHNATIVDKYRDDLASGATLARAAMSHRSRYGYMPPINRRSWSYAMAVIAKMAAESDALAQVANAIIGRVNLYGDDGQAAGAMYDAAFQAMHLDYDDVIGRAGPEAGRFSDHQRPFTLGERVIVQGYLAVATQPFAATAPGHGWCLQIVAESIHVRLPEFDTKVTVLR